MRINGTNVYLESITENDTEDVIRWRNSKLVKERFIYREELTSEIHNEWLKNMVYTKKVVQFIIYEKESSKKIGSVYLRDIDSQNKKCEFGIFIGEENMLGKGYGREATCLIVEYAFSQLGMNKVFLRVLADNERAYRSYLKAGFIKEGIAIQDVWIDGEPRDVVFMSIINKKKDV